MHSGLTPLGTTAYGMNLLKLDKDIEERNRPLSEEELDQILPSEGYEV
jgi:splicing factor 3B subunit 1